jgi:hypothetical protein
MLLIHGQFPFTSVEVTEDHTAGGLAAVEEPPGQVSGQCGLAGDDALEGLEDLWLIFTMSCE